MNKKKCTLCDRTIRSRGHNARFCEDCAKGRARERQRIYEREKYQLKKQTNEA